MIDLSRIESIKSMIVVLNSVLSGEEVNREEVELLKKTLISELLSIIDEINSL